MTKVSTSKTALTTCMLAFARSIQISEGLFFGLNSKNANKNIIEVVDKGVRGQSAEFSAKSQEGKSNPQVVEFASIPTGADQLLLTFNVRVMPFSLQPHACDNNDVRNTYINLVGQYKDAGGFNELARLYVWNIANARFAWRNRYQTDKSKVVVDFSGDTIEFNPSLLSLEKDASVEELVAAATVNSNLVREFIDSFAEGLSKKDASFAFNVSWIADMYEGQEVFPSQEYLRKDAPGAEISRVYAKIRFTPSSGPDKWQASMHSQKIGAALRFIDIWHGNEDFGVVPINPYAGVQEAGIALRPMNREKNPLKNSFYDLQANHERLVSGIEAGNINNDVHFFIANLVRGGVFGSKEAKE